LLYQNLEDNKIDIELREQYVSCFKELIKNTGQQLKLDEEERFKVEIIEKINNYSKDKRFNNREKFMFMDILDFF